MAVEHEPRFAVPGAMEVIRRRPGFTWEAAADAPRGRVRDRGHEHREVAAYFEYAWERDAAFGLTGGAGAGGDGGGDRSRGYGSDTAPLGRTWAQR